MNRRHGHTVCLQHQRLNTFWCRIGTMVWYGIVEFDIALSIGHFRDGLIS